MRSCYCSFIDLAVQFAPKLVVGQGGYAYKLCPTKAVSLSSNGAGYQAYVYSQEA